MRFKQIALSVGMVAAGVICGAGQAPAQTTMLANIPFRFDVPGRQLPPGDYVVTQISNNGIPVLALRNQEAHESVLLLTRVSIYKPEDRRARMVFLCTDGRCTLSEVWGATSSGGVGISVPRDRERPDRTAVVYLKPHKNAD